MENRKVVRVSPEVEALIRKHAAARKLSLGEAADALVITGIARLEALKRYSKKGKRASA